MKTVTASEFQRNFGTYKEIAQREPVTVTSNSRESVVLISIAEFEAYKKSQLAYGGEISGKFETDLDSIMTEHAGVLKGLAK